MKLALIDVSRAHFNARAEEPIYVKLPDELHEEGKCGKRVYNLYGTRITAHAWEITYGGKMKDWGFVRGGSRPCVFRHATRPLWVVVHGDDFITLGPEADIKWFKEKMNSAYQCKLVGMIGPEPEDNKSMKLLNRIVEWKEPGIFLESDQRHAEIIVRELGLENSKGSNTPGTKEKETEEDEEVLDHTEAKVY